MVDTGIDLSTHANNTNDTNNIFVRETDSNPKFLSVEIPKNLVLSDGKTTDNYKDKVQKISLQEAFQKFRRERQESAREVRRMKLCKNTDPLYRERLREMFLEKAKQYFGVPYARKYWSPDSPEYRSPIFLDCCGLVRQILRDLSKEFGFKIGSWNQAYMYDTLPITVDKEEDMKPGDLVFMSGIYTNKKNRKQIHNMTHVEIWLGDGPKTIGSRWNNGKVQVFDSYRFEAKSFHSEQYYFKSIDTWLMGICRSFCPQHPWRRSMFKPGKRSIFSPDDVLEDEDERAGDSDGESSKSDERSCIKKEVSSNLSKTDEKHVGTGKTDILTCNMKSKLINNGDHQTSCEDMNKQIVMNTEFQNSDEVISPCEKVECLDLDPSYKHNKDNNDIKCSRLPDVTAHSFTVYPNNSNLSRYPTVSNQLSHPINDDNRLTPVEICLSASDDMSCKFNGTIDLIKINNLLESSFKEEEFEQEDTDYCCLFDVEELKDDKPLQANADKDDESNIMMSENDQNITGDDLLCIMLSCTASDSDCHCECDYCIQDAPAFQGLEQWNNYSRKIAWTVSENDPDDDMISINDFNSKENEPLIDETIATLEGINTNKEAIDQIDNIFSEQDIADENVNQSNHRTCNRTVKLHTINKLADSPVQFQSNKHNIFYHEEENDGIWSSEPEDSETSDNKYQRSTSLSVESTHKSQGSGNNGGDGKEKIKRGGGKRTPGGRTTKLPTCSLPNNMLNTFYIGGGNGVALVEGALLNLGWKRTTDKHDERFKLKWVECKSKINYQSFREGDQLVNHIPNCHLLTNKLGLINSLQEYERVTLSTKGRSPRLKIADIVPETYRLDDKNDRETFLETYKDGEIWICKPTGMNQGKGIFLLRSKEEIDKLLSEREEKQQQQRKVSRPLMSRIVQRYIHNPLLLDGRKFDIRAYMLIASTSPFLVVYHKGYVRLSCMKYDGDDTNLTTHLTNQYIQKKDPTYQDVKEDTAWSMDKINDYINENVAPEKDLEQDWIYSYVTKQMQRVMLHCFNCVKHKLQSKIGYFDLYGLDFMIDTDMKVWMIEINVNPSLSTNCEALKEVIPSVVEEAINISIECFDKSRKHQSLIPIQSLNGFSVLYCGSQPNAVQSRPARTISPNKDTTDKSSKPTQIGSTNRRSGVSPSRSFVPKTNTSHNLAPVQSKSSNSQELGLYTKSPYNSAILPAKPIVVLTKEPNQNNSNKSAIKKTTTIPPSTNTQQGNVKTVPKSTTSSKPSPNQNVSKKGEDVKLKMVHSSPVNVKSDNSEERGN